MLLSDIKTVFISPCKGKYLDKCKTMKEFLKHKMKSNDWNLHESELIYPNGLKNAFLNIMKDNLSNSTICDNPLLILEDDIDWSGEQILENIPSNADAMYLGIAAVGNGTFPLSSCNIVNTTTTDIFKVNSMRSTHAILYLTKKYKEAVYDAVKKSMEHHYDITLAGLQHNYNVYAYNNPIFHQNGNDVNARLTRTSLARIYHERNGIKLFIGFLILISICFTVSSFVSLQK